MISNNTIAAKDHCINIEDGPAPFIVSNNSLTLLPPTSFPNRAALRVFNVGNPNLSKPLRRIKDHVTGAAQPITIHSNGNGIVLENMGNTNVEENEVFYQTSNATASDGIRLVNSVHNYLYGNAVQAVGDFPNLRNIHLAGAQNNKLCCNSTDGGGTGLYFFGTSSSENGLNNTTIGQHNIGLLCEVGTTIGLQEHRGNTWTGSYGDKAAVHRGSLNAIEQSTFRVQSPQGSPFWPAMNLILTTNPGGAQWFEPFEGSASLCEANANCQSPSVGVPPGGKESDRKVAEGDYMKGDYAAVHNWEAGLDLFARLDKNETLRKSEAWYQSFYAKANTDAIGAYTRVRGQFETLLNLSSEEGKQADALGTAIQDNLKTLADIGTAYGKATTEADSTKLEAAWLKQYALLGGYFADWRALSASVHKRVLAGVPALQKANAALPEHIVPAANEKLMNSLQLKRVLGEALTEKEYSDLAALASSCPLEAGNAVYRARTWLRTQGSYVFDDNDLCGLGKEKPEEEGDGKKSLSLDNRGISSRDTWPMANLPQPHPRTSMARRTKGCQPDQNTTFRPSWTDITDSARRGG